MAAPIKGTPGNNPTINGTAGNDKLQGKGGDDFLKGGLGNDDIDGGQGFDTAIFTGSFFDYDIAVKGTGNDKVTVTDHVANRDGTDNLKQVEALQFGDVTIRLDQNNAAVTRADTATTSEDSSVVIACSPTTRTSRATRCTSAPSTARPSRSAARSSSATARASR